MKKYVTSLMLCLLMLPLVAQTQGDTIYHFRFEPGNDGLYTAYRNNGTELSRLLACVVQNKEAILAGTVPIQVDGYCNSLDDETEARATARIRSNRVKSELITREGLTEACFTTRHHTSGGDYVTVRIVIPTSPSETGPEQQAETERLAAEAQRATAEQEAEQARQAAKQQRTEASHPAHDSYHLALRANLLRWATLTPDLGIEWRICPSWGIAVNGSWTSWTWSDKDRRYALWEVAPEVRYYMGEKKAWYLGAMFKAGQFNYKLSETGRQGDLMGGGITAGYQLRLNKALDLDFNLGLGYLNADYEKYEVIDGVRVRRGNETKDWWGPINAGVTLVWKLF
ncbi:hypothetical protein BARVI_04405 [Barnesiella viscericola DSM 18177]|uniref:DUF3575 domain-containing protein n=1 Tax=Barnesiella viscericola DSM 18177 TaxID=880074 RepID=W0EN04_9BACT|nr:DUF3575 domain-containing protein [Barnesiella viscericola]AHF12152.1 hypothetical protein BARVI_04405 [Barnesiella viscericola DSM 18177]